MSAKNFGMEKPSKEEIRRVRKEARLTQTQFARLLELPDRTISRWETGKGGPSALAWAHAMTLVTLFVRNEASRRRI